MKRFVLATLRRLAVAIMIVWGVTSAVFVLVSMLPGDPVQATLGPNASPADVEHAREIWGLDRPLGARYVAFFARLVHREGGGEPAKGEHASCARVAPSIHVDLGVSPIYRKPVVELLKKKVSASIDLALAAMLVQLALGLSLGALAGMRRGSRTDRLVVAGVTALGAAPTFVIGLALQFALAHKLGLFPLDGQGAQPGERLRSIALPALTLGLYGSAVLARTVRTELQEALEQAYVRTARAKGAGPLRTVIVHAARNAAGPVSQLVVLELGALVGGAIVTEKLFRWPGLGELSVVAIQNRDAPALVGVTLVASVAMALATALADIIALALDPRRR